MDRLTRLYRDWSGCAPDACDLLPLSGSARKYYRMSGEGGTVIGCIGTNPAENRAFLALDAQFCAQGLHAPALYGVSPDWMAYLQEDLGDGQLFELLKPALADGSFTQPDREFNARMVDFDLNYLKYDFLKLTGLEFNEIRLQDDFDRLRADALGFAGDTFMYRDFQARNVMIKDGEPCFVDFQGGRRGPVQYDLASFLWNAGTHFDAAMRRELELVYLRALDAFRPVDEPEFYRQYRLLTLVRLLQETGAYGFRGLVERKQLFLDCIPTVLRAFRELTAEPFARYPYLTEVLQRLAAEWDGRTILPGVEVAL